MDEQNNSATNQETAAPQAADNTATQAQGTKVVNQVGGSNGGC